MPGVRTASATTLAIIGLLVWVLDRYVFQGNLPSPISAAIYTIVPAAVGWIYTHKALNEIPPAMKAQIAAKLKGAPVVLPDQPTTEPRGGTGSSNTIYFSGGNPGGSGGGGGGVGGTSNSGNGGSGGAGGTAA